ncbi:MAG: N-6 DNA methylase [Bacteroidetes bacterium]|nr:N-6 DNA methylase [Bacteroidota bacterium]
MTGLNNLFVTLGLDRSNGLFITQEGLWKNETGFPNRVKRLIERKIRPDAFFCFDNKPLILFFENPINKDELHKAIWNFNECPIAIITNGHSIEIFNGFNYLKEKASLQKIGGSGKLTDFSYFELVTGRTWEQYNEHLGYKNRIDYHLLENIKAARDLLVEEHELDTKIVNAIIGKAIFVRYLIDRKVKMRFDGKLRTWSNDEFCDLLNSPKSIRNFFDYFEDNKEGFNGDLFPLTSAEYKKITKEDYQVIKRLLKGEDIYNGQLSLFQLYDFSIIPIEFISNVYELFIGENNQQAEGAYYTPLFLVDYILKETVDKKLNADQSDFTCKVLDPACGSGIFLVETLRKIIEKFILETGIDTKSEKFKTAIRKLAKENIFGVDKDASAIQVAVFSIYLTLLDYLEPPGIETFKFPNLIESNFFNADFFDETASFNNQINEIEFAFIVGNPPWKGSSMTEIGNKYLKNRKEREKREVKKYQIAINNNEIAEGFVLRVSDFCKEATQIALIIRSSILYNLGYNDKFSPFRQYWLEEFFIDRVFELAPVRFEVFEKSNQPAVAPAAVVFYRYAYSKNTDFNKTEHITLKESQFFSLFKIFTINRSDYKEIEQRKLKQDDWVWKTLVYGSYLDYNLLKRIKDSFPTIKSVVSDSNKVIEGTGLQYSSNPTYSSKHLIGLPFIDAYGVSPFFIEVGKISEFKKAKVHRLRDERLFKAPMLLIREGIDMSTLTAKCSVSRKDLLFKDSITSIKAFTKANISILDNIAAIFSTSLFAYYAVNTFASIGIERERVKNYNKYSLPYLELEASEHIRTIEQALQLIYLEKNKALHDESKIQNLTNTIKSAYGEIEKSVYKKLNFTAIEFSLVDYALQINRKFIIGTEDEKKKLFLSLAFEDKTLGDYASIFIKRFKSQLDTPIGKFIVEIWHTKQIVGMFFKTVNDSDGAKQITWINKQNNEDEILSLLTKVSSDKITDKLFIQKDIRGFEKDYFYIVKPNERRLWHKAIAHLDVNEFADAILKAGRAGK